MIKSRSYEHKGWIMRSHTEFQWANVMDAARIGYLHEPERFDTRHGWYLPDFYLPKIGAYIEVKGVEPSQVEREKAEDVMISTGKVVVFVSGKPTPDRNGFSGCSAWFFWSAKLVRIPMCTFSDVYIAELGESSWSEIISSTLNRADDFAAKASEILADYIVDSPLRGFYERISSESRAKENERVMLLMPEASPQEELILKGVAMWKARKKKD